jgi:hypothetical protein
MQSQVGIKKRAGKTFPALFTIGVNEKAKKVSISLIYNLDSRIG